MVAIRFTRGRNTWFMAQALANLTTVVADDGEFVAIPITLNPNSLEPSRNNMAAINGTVRNVLVQIQTNVLNDDASYTFRAAATDTDIILTILAGVNSVLIGSGSAPIVIGDIMSLRVDFVDPAELGSWVLNHSSIGGD